MQVAVGQVAEDVGLPGRVVLRQFGLHLRGIGRNARQRHRDIVGGRSRMRAVDDVGVFAQPPQGFFLARGAGDDAGGAGVACFGFFKQGLECGAQAVFLRTAEFEQQVHGLVQRKTVFMPAQGLRVELHKARPQRLGCAQMASVDLQRTRNHVQRGFHRGQTEQRGGRCRGQGVELDHQAGHHAQRALRADEEMLQVVAGRVLNHPSQVLEHAAVG